MSGPGGKRGLRRRRGVLGVTLIVIMLLALPAAAGAEDTLRAGVGRADITPPTGYYTQGWVRSDAKGTGQLTRLFARVIVLERGGHKLALVAEDLNGIAGGSLVDAANRVGDIGFSEQNVLDSASHTHAAPGGYFNFSTYNTVAPTPNTPTQLSIAFDPQLYGFLVDRLALAIRRANANLGAARVGWGHGNLLGVTENRSLEAHLANFGIQQSPGTGTAAQDPGGYPGTIDPNVDVLRVDKLFGALPAIRAPARCRTVRVRRRSRLVRVRRCGPVRRRAGARRSPRTVARAASTPVLATTGPARAQSARSPAKRRPRRPHRHRRRRTRPAAVRWVTVGLWSQFADHGTVIKSDFRFYNADHHGEAIRRTEDALRSAGAVPPGQDVVNVYGNGDAGDMSAGLHQSGPAAADSVGRRESDAFIAAWQQAGSSMTTTPTLDLRWTRMCFCGQTVDGMATPTSAAFGEPQLTGSEEGRGGLYQLTGRSNEGDHLPYSAGPQGDKIIDVPDTGNGFPRAVPLMAVRIADRMIVSVPGEPTVQVGKRLRDAVLAGTAAAGIHSVIVAGYSNEYLSYFTTPEEYDAQHYEGGSTLYGRESSVLVQQSDLALAQRLIGGLAAPAPYPYDPANGVKADETPFDTGASSARATDQPANVGRLARASFSWQGGARGLDRPLDTPFVRVLAQIGGQWRETANDLGLQILWTGDPSGAYSAKWEVPLDAPTGTYEFQVTANHYTLTSQPFTVSPANSLTVGQAPAAAATLAVDLNYPEAVVNSDLTDRPVKVTGGSVRFLVNGRAMTVPSSGAVFAVPAGLNDNVTVPAGGARDAYGNTNAQPLQVNPAPPGGDVPGRP